MVTHWSRAITIGLMTGLILLTFAIGPVSAAKLATPNQILPANNQVFYHTNYRVTLAWKPVANADLYFIENEFKDGNNWINVGNIHIVQPGIQLYPWPGSFRWRITANNTTGAYQNSSPSQWRTFNFTVPSFKLQTPVQLSPNPATVLYHVPRTLVLAWKPIPGAERYHVEFQWYDPGSTSWNALPSVDTVKGSTVCGYLMTFNGPYQGRWRVTANTTTGEYLNSTPSQWRTFTFKN